MGIINQSGRGRDKSRVGDVALHVAVRGEELHIVELLLGYGASIEIANKTGITPLHIASQNNRQKAILNALLAKKTKTSLSKKTSSGSTPLHWTARNGNVYGTEIA